MRCVAITCARNEADIIEAFVRHTLACCQALIVLDHGSTDSTPEILRQLQAEGLPLHVIRDPSIGRLHVEQMNRLLLLATRDFAADWIFCLDADEFISTPAGNSFLPPQVDENTPCLKLRVRNYYSQPGDPADVLNPVERITRRLAREPETGDPSLYKMFIPAPLAKKDAAHLVSGCHLFRTGGVEAPSRIPEEVCLAHFSLRSPGQYAIKLASKRLQALRFISPMADEGAHYADAYARMSASYSSFVDNFHRERLSYLPAHDAEELVSDPLHYLGGPLRHTAPVSDFDGFARQMLDLAEALARPGGDAGEYRDGANDVTHPLLRIEAFRPGKRGQSRVCDTAPGARHLLQFPLDLSPQDTSFHLRILCEPGMLEITRFSLLHPGPSPLESAYDGDALRKNLRVISDAAVLPSDHVFRLLISREPAVLAFQNWKKDGLPPPASLHMEVRYEDRLEKSVILHPAVLNAMNRDSAEREISARKLGLLLDGVNYIPGSVIDFSDRGNAIIHLQNGWCNPEPWGTWTEGHEAALKIRFQEIPKRDIVLNAQVKGLVNRLRRTVRSDILVNGEKLAALEVDKAEFEKFQLKIPAGKIQSRECVITFKISDPRSPETLGISGDKRLLGLGFGKLDLQW